MLDLFLLMTTVSVLLMECIVKPMQSPLYSLMGLFVHDDSNFCCHSLEAVVW